MTTRREILSGAAAAAMVAIAGPALAMPSPFEIWKTAYRQRIALRAHVPFAETEHMIADDQTLMEMFLQDEEPIESADIEMSYWEA